MPAPALHLDDALGAALSTGVAQLDAALTLVAVNAGLCELLGVGAARLRGRTLAALAPGEDGLLAGARVVLAAGHVWRGHGVVFCAEPPATHALDVVLTPCGDGLLLEAQSAATPESPPRLSASLRGFAHEVRNPLAGLRGAAQLIRRRVDDAELAELAGLIVTEADRLSALADRLLHPPAPAPRAALNIHDPLERVAALVEAEAGAPSVQRDYDPSLPDAHGDADRLQQLLLNLARNALEAGARHLILRTRAEHGLRMGAAARPVLRVEVIDDGGGVPEALRATLFEPLVSGRADGSGLGLALAREIAREHGGELHHERRGELTVFVLRLPLRGAGHD